MNVSLTPQMVKFVEAEVASGAYQTASEVVRDGLRMLQERKQDRQARLEEIRQQIAVGLAELDRGERFTLDIEEIKAEGRRRLAEKESRNAGEVRDVEVFRTSRAGADLVEIWLYVAEYSLDAADRLLAAL